jgi:hypothetical protein
VHLAISAGVAGRSYSTSFCTGVSFSACSTVTAALAQLAASATDNPQVPANAKFESERTTEPERRGMARFLVSNDEFRERSRA